MDYKALYDEKRSMVLAELNAALAGVDASQVGALIDALESAEKVFFVGVGRVMLSLQAIAKRLKHLGFDTYVVGETTEPPIGEKDLLIVGSGSGSTLVPSGLAKKAKGFVAKIAHIGCIPDNPISPITDVFVRIPCKNKKAMDDVVPSKQPMTTLFEQCVLLLGGYCRRHDPGETGRRGHGGSLVWTRQSGIALFSARGYTFSNVAAKSARQICRALWFGPHTLNGSAARKSLSGVYKTAATCFENFGLRS
ncbi:SIS domain-containing protein [Guopingia tenuis]|uniref:SIS domain-containing protein n=1 Tax=Guopingia tenuis TaxID=2763656 RepID=UPI0020161495|nr:SIS domain-containing protein [Guopingia tenuis]